MRRWWVRQRTLRRYLREFEILERETRACKRMSEEFQAVGFNLTPGMARDIRARRRRNAARRPWQG